MFDRDIYKKENESYDLALFIEAYEFITGKQLEILQRNENPDFICSLPDGSLIGIELSKVMRDPRDASDDWIINRKYEIDVYDSVSIIQNLIVKKEEARSERYIKNVNDNMLVLLLKDGSLKSLKNILNSLIKDFNEQGFQEIWLADYTDLEACGDIELFCMFPSELWGYYQRPWPERKPFG
jgi:hypothetical protein